MIGYLFYKRIRLVVCSFRLKFAIWIYTLYWFACFPILLIGASEPLIPVILNKIPHLLPAFTQGLAIEGNYLYESTGLYGQSSLRMLDLSTGQILHKQTLEPEIFAEGIAVFPHQIIQITWKEQRAYIYESLSLKFQKTLSYSGEGWGLCRDGNTVWMSDGSSILTQRDPFTFISLKKIQVRLNGFPLERLNDLECVGNTLYANVWPKNWIVRINKETGEVTGVIDASTLLSKAEKARLSLEEVLNGIAFHPKKGTFFVTGKGWPWIFEVHFISQSR